MTPETAREILDLVQTKQAQTPASTAPPEALDALLQSLRERKHQLLRNETMRMVGKAMLGGAGFGLTARGVKGVADLFKPRPQPPQPFKPLVLDIPYPQEEEQKIAQWPEIITKPVETTQQWLSDVASGRAAETPMGHPLFLPGTILGGGAAAYGGWKALDTVLNAMKEKERKQELSTAKEKYQRALLSQYGTRGRKLAETQDEVGAKLDDLFEKVSQDLPGTALGAYLTAALPLLGVSGYLGYQRGKRQTRRFALEEAKRLRARKLWEQRAPEVFARPVEPLALPAPSGDVTQEELEAAGITEAS